MTTPQMRWWIPERLVHVDDSVRCKWIDIGDIRFTDPFFEDTLARRRRDTPERRETPLEVLHDAVATADALAPSAFIFHVSRCGSTLLAQLLGCDAGAVVLSEVPVLDELLRSTLPHRDALFVSALRFLGQRRFGSEQRLFVKLDCWHVFYAALLRQVYPDTPFILLYRSPEAVLASHHRMRGMHMVPGVIERLPFVGDYDPARMSLDQYAATVLEGYYRALLDVAAADGRALLVSYDEGFPAAYERVAEWLGLPLDASLRTRVHERCAHDGKRPGTLFTPPDTGADLQVNLQPLRELFDRLETQRQSRR